LTIDVEVEEEVEVEEVKLADAMRVLFEEIGELGELLLDLEEFSVELPEELIEEESRSSSHMVGEEEAMAGALSDIIGDTWFEYYPLDKSFRENAREVLRRHGEEVQGD